MSGQDTATRRAEVAPEAPAITRDPAICAGDPVLAGTRIPVHDVVSYVALYDWDLERAKEQEFPDLTMDQMEAALQYYRAHREEIEEILRARREDYARATAAGQRPL